jgi:hypothetical protein
MTKQKKNKTIDTAVLICILVGSMIVCTKVATKVRSLQSA